MHSNESASSGWLSVLNALCRGEKAFSVKCSNFALNELFVDGKMEKKTRSIGCGWRGFKGRKADGHSTGGWLEACTIIIAKHANPPHKGVSITLQFARTREIQQNH